jgi:hypothetical protein
MKARVIVNIEFIMWYAHFNKLGLSILVRPGMDFFKVGFICLGFRGTIDRGYRVRLLDYWLF